MSQQATRGVYDEAFFAFHEEGSRASARAVVPIILNLAAPASVIDIGCGIGTWLVEFQAAGVTDLLGVDGDYVDRNRLLIARERFQSHDLSQRLEVGRRFDLAMSAEVAEHLPESSADSFVASLVALADVVLFSAAIPFQQGDGHVNEQWPEYWQEKFARHDYVVVDCLRDRLWNLAQVKWWYAQNLFFYVRRDLLPDYPQLAAELQRVGQSSALARVHPKHYEEIVGTLKNTVLEWQTKMMRLHLNLREVCLLVAPAWTAPREALLSQLRTLLAATLAHPQGGQMTLVIDTARDPAVVARDLLRQAAGEILLSGDAVRVGAPQLAVVGDSFEATQWEILGHCAAGRVLLESDDPHPALLTSVGRLISIDDIRQRQLLSQRQ